MDLFTASNAFAQIVGLICNFRQERGAQQDADFQSFITWLTNHKFERIREQICASREVQREFETLFADVSGDLNDKLDALSSVVRGIAEKIDGLDKFAVCFPGGDQISEDALAILDWFDASQEPNMLFSSSVPQLTCCALLPSGKSVKTKDIRFMADDVAKLEALNFIQRVRYNGSGDPIFTLTRNGARYAQLNRKAQSTDVSDN